MKLQITTLRRIPDEDVRRNEAYAESLGFPKLGTAKRPRLAVVGGGPSILDHLGELAAFDGEIWAINGTFHYLRGHGIAASFASFDASPLIAGACEGADHAVLATCCHPDVFNTLMDAEIEAVRVGLDGFWSGPTTASTIPGVAIARGHKEIVFYGCESSFGSGTHAYHQPVQQASRLLVACDGREFLTNPAFFVQTQDIAEMIRAAPNVFSERSGGLLRAMVNDPDYDVIAASRSIYENAMKVA